MQERALSKAKALVAAHNAAVQVIYDMKRKITLPRIFGPNGGSHSKATHSETQLARLLLLLQCASSH
jgi:hypothetical protein